MTVYRIVLPKDSKLDHRVLKGIGRLERDTPVEMKLSAAQIKSLKARGIEVIEKKAIVPPAPKPEPKKKSADPGKEG